MKMLKIKLKLKHSIAYDMRNSKKIQISRENMEDFSVPTDHKEDKATFFSLTFASSHKLISREEKIAGG